MNPPLTSEPTRLRLGYVRADGKVFWSYNRKYKDGEVWLTPEKFAEVKARKTLNEAKWRKGRSLPEKKFKAGDLGPDGRIFWGRSRAKGEIWMTEAEFSKERDRVNARNRTKWREDPLHRTARIWRAKIREILQAGEDGRYCATEEIIGCSASQLRRHFSSLFKDEMSWENRHLWHVDHITPCASASTLGHLKKLFHYTNLQPLWVEENHVKGASCP